MPIINPLLPVVRDVMDALRKRLQDSQQAQGHNLTGRLKDSIDYEIAHDDNTVTAKMYMEDYGVFVEFGVPAERIPFGGKSGKGGTSKYIQGLISFFELRGLSGREAVGAAFATAHKHKREGMPTRNSRRFSKTGERTGFIRTVIEEDTKDITERIEKEFGFIIEFLFKDGFTGYENITTA